VSEPVAQTIFWDFDGTLAFHVGGWRGAMLALLNDEDLARIDREALGAALKQGFPWHAPEVVHAHLMTADLWWDHLLVRLQSAYVASGINGSRAAELAHLFRAHFTDPTQWRLFDDALPVLRRLAEAGWQNIILSNHIPELPDLSAHLGFADVTCGVITSAATGYEKPNALMYQHALQFAGNPPRRWMVGDNPVADVEGAEAAGIPAILVRTPNRLVERSAADLWAAAAIIEPQVAAEHASRMSG